MSKLEHAGASSTTPPGAPARTPRARPRPSTPRRRTGTDAAERLVDQRRAPRRSPPRASRARASDVAQVLEVAALEPAAHDRDDAASKLSIARRADAMLVAFESLTNRTPSISATRSSACSSPRNPSTARRIAAGGDAGHARRPPPPPARRPAGAGRAAAPTTPARAARVAAASRRTIVPPLDGDAVARPARRARSRTAARARSRASAQRRRIVGVDDGPVVGRLVREDPRLRRARTPRTSACRSRWSGERFSSTAIHGWNVSVVSSWKLLTSTTWTRVRRATSSTCALSGGADVAARRHVEAGRLEHARRQRRRRRLALRAGDRDRRGPSSQRDASSSSPMTGTPARARGLDGRLIRRHAGAQHDQIAPSRTIARDAAPSSSVDAERRAAGPRSSSDRRRVGQRHARAARDAAARRRPRRSAPPPTTTTRLPAHA